MGKIHILHGKDTNFPHTIVCSVSKKRITLEEKCVMKKIRYRLVYNRRGKLTRQGTALVQVEAYLEKRHMYMSTGVYLRPEHWDDETGTVTPANPNHVNLNAFLFECMFNVEKVELELWRRGIRPSLQMVREQMGSRCTCDTSFHAFAEEHIRKSSRRKGSKENMRSTLKLLRTFRPDYDWGDLTYTFLHDFDTWLRQRGCCTNTVGKHLRQLRTLLNEAVRQGYLPSSPFARFRIRHEDTAHAFLTPDELRRLERLTPDKPRLLHTLHAYLFCCYTGLRYSDFTALRRENIVMRGGKRWLVFRSRKTNVETDIPLYLMGGGRAEEILARYPDVEALARIGCNREVNHRLRELARMARIAKHMTFHTARHTCATTLVYEGVPITSVQKVLGHRKVSTTQIYSEVHAATLVRDLTPRRRK